MKVLKYPLLHNLKNPKVGPNWRAKRGPFKTSIVSKHRQIEGETLWDFFGNKILTMPKKLKGDPFSLAQYCMLRGKRGKTFLILFARPNGSI